ncbi:molybdenum cofactor sulfurase [Aricia agestis]|uniref:molybdenum cofactor sulfurase n=1 Tax=Aricia agestis TaxID=91739 RepID=UPI001C2089E3|nr:molybdenum cofactor sulfurase [Aricia agestis]
MSILSQIIDDANMKNITKEFSRLGDKCYLDNAGAALYPESLLRKINEDLLNSVYMNPHSDKYTKDCVDQIRYLILNHFNTDSSNYSVIFTSGATQSMKLVLEAFQFHNETNNKGCGSFVYLRDNHTSAIGLREIAKMRDVDVLHVSKDEFLDSLITSEQMENNWEEQQNHSGNTLFVYPAQSNFNGFKYPINCIDKIKNGCLNTQMKKHLCDVDCNWYIMLDVASYVGTSKLDLSVTRPDFICMSFYKIFGYPTGLGALLVKNSSANLLSQKKYFGGGTVDIVLSTEDFHIKRQTLHERFEDGTIPFLSVILLKHCFDTIYNLIPKSNNIMDVISYHTFYLAKDLYEQLLHLKHVNGSKAIMFYMDSDFTDIHKQGGIVTFNIMREDGSYIGYAEFQHMAELFNIHIRTGCFCNAGTCQRHLKLSNKELKELYKSGHKCGDEIDLVKGQPTGAIRVSFGYYNTFEDVDKVVAMITNCFVKTKPVTPKRQLISIEGNLKLPTGKLLKTSNINIMIDKTVDSVPRYDEQEFEITLMEIAIFPIKSCGAFKPQSWKVGHKGFEYDREWMIIRENGVCLTQKQNTYMCMILPDINLEEKCMVLNFKGMTSIKIPLDPLASKYTELSLCQSKVCTDIVKGYDCGDDVANWISEALGISFLRLIKQSDDHERVRKKNLDEKQTLLSLSNQAQFLLINRATVKWLQDRISDPSFVDDLPSVTDRFRGNLVIDMKKELVESEWKLVIIDGHEFKVENQCSRCQMVCIDQKTGEKTVEPLRTISKEFGALKFGIYLSFIGHKSKNCVLRTKSQVVVKM